MRSFLNVRARIESFYKKKCNLVYMQRIFRELTGKSVIHVFGDSHTELFFDKYYIIHYVGPATAYKLSSPSSTVNASKKVHGIIMKTLDKKEEMYCLFVFGEIDCRLHIYNVHMKQKIPVDIIIGNVVIAYKKFLENIKSVYPNVKILVFNVLPPGEQGNIYGYPYYAKRDIQYAITEKMNEQLRMMCQKQQYMFVDIFKELIDNNGNRKKIYKADDVHINKKAVKLVNQRLQQLGII